MTEKKLIPVMRDTIFGEIEDCSEELLEIGIDSIMDDLKILDLEKLFGKPQKL